DRTHRVLLGSRRGRQAHAGGSCAHRIAAGRRHVAGLRRRSAQSRRPQGLQRRAAEIRGRRGRLRLRGSAGLSRDSLAERVHAGGAANAMLWSMGLVALLGLLAGLTAFHLITRPLRTLTEAVRGLEAHGMSWLPQARPLFRRAADSGSDLLLLSRSFESLAQRIDEQWRALRDQDRLRRELFANLSHDLRTPLTSLHGYLETLRMKSDALDPRERQRYLDIALEQSRKVGRLAQEMFELARLEYGMVRPQMEPFFLTDLLQDV